jgi:hypothetical protein
LESLSLSGCVGVDVMLAALLTHTADSSASTHLQSATSASEDR